MKKYIELICIVLIIHAMLSGCASSGKNFKYQNRNLIELQKTTVDEAVQYLGKPSSKQFKSTKDGDFEILKYVYGYATPSGASARVFFLEFKNGKLNGKIYNSGFKEDITEFNFENFKKIKIGLSNKEDVIKFLGAPSGKAICPSTFFSDKCKDATETWSWIHTKTSEGYDTKTMKSKTLAISFDSIGSVVNIDASKEEDN